MEWISVKDRLPEVSKSVLISDGRYVTLGWLRNPEYITKKASKWDSLMGVRPNTTHWMPLPEPPKESIN